MKAISVLIFILSVLFSDAIFAQGCSDAGFCSVDGLKSPSVSTIIEGDSLPTVNTLKTGMSLGNTRYSVWILTSYIGYSRQINPRSVLSMKLDGQARFGKLTSVVGFSDMTISLSHQFSGSFGIIVGGKIPLTNANRTFNGQSLPMAFQTGLGTWDALIGAHYSRNKLFFAAGYQQPIIQNSNAFRSDNFTESELGAMYPETFQFKRAGDILFRISYRHNPRATLRKFSFTYNLLPIFHLGNDQYTDEENIQRDIEDSKGLTLNTNVFAYYALNHKTGIEISTGLPVMARKSRPEGLSQFALSVELTKKF